MQHRSAFAGSTPKEPRNETMTQLLTQRTADAAVASVLPSASPTWSRPRRRPWVLPAVGGVVVVAVVTLAWTISGWTRAVRASSEVGSFVVQSRDFNVSLREKGELKAAKSTDIINLVEGKSTIISLVPEGTSVKQGDLLVELASDEIEKRIREEELKEANAVTSVEVARTQLDVQRDKNLSDIRKANLEVELKTLEFEKYREGDWGQKLKDANIAIDQAQILLERRRDDFASAEQLYAKKFITKTEYEEDKFNLQKAEWDLEKARKAKEVLEEYTHRADLRQKESDVEEAQKELVRVTKNAEAEELQKLRSLEGKEKELVLIQDQLAKFRVQRDKCRIFAPTQGFVVYFGGEGGGRGFMGNNDTQIREGATVHERQVLMTLPDTSEMLVVVRVHEAKSSKLALGQRVSVTVEGVPGRALGGAVTKIAQLADTQNRWLNPDLKEYETEITLDPVDLPLKPGVTAVAEILVDSVEQKLAVPVQAIYARGGKRFVFRNQSGAVSPVEVKLGAIGAEYAEVREGLAESESVLLAFSDEHKRMIGDVAAPERQGGGPRRRDSLSPPGVTADSNGSGGGSDRATSAESGANREGRGERGRGERRGPGAREAGAPKAADSKKDSS